MAVVNSPGSRGAAGLAVLVRFSTSRRSAVWIPSLRLSERIGHRCELIGLVGRMRRAQLGWARCTYAQMFQALRTP